MYPTGQKRDLDFLRTKFHPFYEGKMADIADEFNHFLHNNYHLLMWDG